MSKYKKLTEEQILQNKANRLKNQIVKGYSRYEELYNAQLQQGYALRDKLSFAAYNKKQRNVYQIGKKKEKKNINRVILNEDRLYLRGSETVKNIIKNLKDIDPTINARKTEIEILKGKAFENVYGYTFSNPLEYYDTKTNSYKKAYSIKQAQYLRSTLLFGIQWYNKDEGGYY